MKVIEPQSATLSNYEVLTHLTNLKEQYAATPKIDPKTGQPMKATYKRRGPPKYETVVNEVIDYLKTSPSPLATQVYDSTTMKTLITRLRPYDLTKAEILMILNLRPSDVCQLSMVVEELYERHGEEVYGYDRPQEMIDIIAEVLGKPEPEGDEEPMET